MISSPRDRLQMSCLPSASGSCVLVAACLQAVAASPVAAAGPQEVLVHLGRPLGAPKGDLEVRFLGPRSDAIPARAGQRFSLFLPDRRLARGTWGALPPTIAAADLEADEAGGRLLLRLAPDAGEITLETGEAGLRLHFAPGPAPGVQTFRPVEVGGEERNAAAPPWPAADRAAVPARPPATAPTPPPRKAREGPPPSESAPPPAPHPPPETPPPAPPPKGSEGAARQDGWGLVATDLGLEIRLIPVEGSEAWGKIPEEVRRYYRPFVAAARVAKDSPYVFRFRQRPDRFRFTLKDERTVGSLDLRGRGDLRPKGAGDLDALFDTLDLYPGTQHGGLVLFPSTFDLEQVTRLDVMIRGEYHEMPPVR